MAYGKQPGRPPQAEGLPHDEDKPTLVMLQESAGKRTRSRFR